jgi:hypothetical protein
MASKSFSDYPKEIQEYLQSSEQLLAAAASPDKFPLSHEQRGVIVRYAVDVLTALSGTRKKSH